MPWDAILVGLMVGASYLFGAWVQKRRDPKDYRKLWRESVEIMEQIQAENERVISERDEAIELSRHLHAHAAKVDARIEAYGVERENLRAQLQSMFELQRRDREAEIEKRRARTIAEKYSRRMPPKSGALKRALKEARYR